MGYSVVVMGTSWGGLSAMKKLLGGRHARIGANEDGARGLAHIVKRGGRALVQDPKTAEIPIMPQAAIKAVPTAEVVPLHRPASRLIELSREDAKARAAGERRYD